MILFLNSEKDVLLYTCTCTYFRESKRGKKKENFFAKNIYKWRLQLNCS